MSCSKLFLSCLLLQLTSLFLVPDVAHGLGLKVGFYEKACPNAEAIVKEVMAQVLSKAPGLSGPLLRMHFHDCFVRVSKRASERASLPTMCVKFTIF